MEVEKSEICNAFPLPSWPPQVSNAHLRLVRLTPADSGEYVCRVSGGSVPQEASFMVSVVANTSPASRTSGIPGGGESGRVEGVRTPGVTVTLSQQVCRAPSSP